jgi:hypothetical protein
VRDAENLIGSQVKWCRASVGNLNVLRANGVQNVSQALFVTASRPGRLLAWGVRLMSPTTFLELCLNFVEEESARNIQSGM